VVDAGEQLLTPDQVAKRLAVSRSMVYAEIKKTKMKALYVGRLPRITEAALAEYLAKASAR
jgi:excisionase family DNA binding protein